MSEQTTNNQDDIITRPVAWIVKPKGEPIFSERSYRVDIVDEAGGEFVKVTDGELKTISIDPSDWNKLRNAIERAVKQCKPDDRIQDQPINFCCEQSIRSEREE